jgi:D-xylose 1-dehydrogenase (NADP+, D-xylono-1,5-lactone-forming)
MKHTARSSVAWGVIGCGQIAIDKSLPGLLHSRNARLVAVADPLETRRRLALEQAARHELRPRTYADAFELLANPEVEAVYIALPTGMHAEAVVAAAQAGKAILCEKPLGRSAEETRTMIHAARQAGVPLMTAYMSRFSDVFQRTVQLLHEGAIGRITFVNAHFSYDCLCAYPPGAPGGWRWTDGAGGGPLLDIGVYLAFGLREMLGQRIVRVAPLNHNTVAPPEAAVNDTTAAWFVTEHGIPGTFVAAFSHRYVQLDFHGTQGRLAVGNLFNQTPGGRLEHFSEEGTFVFDTTNDPGLPHFDNYRREFEHFSAALLDGAPFQPAPEAVLEDALLLDTLKGTSNPLAVPSPEQFLEML